MNIKELKEQLKIELKNIFIEEVSEDLASELDNCRGYICDIITTHADEAVDIYTYNRLEWLKDNYSYVDEANDELGGESTDILEQIAQAQFYKAHQDLNNDITEIIQTYTINTLLKAIEELPEEQEINEQALEEFTSEVEEIETGNDIEDLNEVITAYIEVLGGKA